VSFGRSPSNSDAKLALRVHAVNAQVTILDALERLGVALPAGKATHQIKCPFHVDSTPSARIYADNNRVFCFTCGKGWDPIEAARDLLGVGFPEAVEWLEQQFGLEDPSDPAIVGDVIRARLRQRGEMNLPALYDYAEKRLRSLRGKVSLDRYTRAFVVFDTVCYQHKARQLNALETVAAVKKVLAFAEKKEP
jgi:DNA primase